MASSKEYLNYILELFIEVSNISYRKMMGEYIIYKNNVVIGGVYDDRLLFKDTPSLKEYNFKEVVPYPNAKPMFLVDSEDPDFIKELVDITYNDLAKN